MPLQRLLAFLRARWPRILLVLVLLAVFFGNQGFRSMVANWFELRALSREISALEDENRRVSGRLQELRESDAAVESEARKMGFVKPGEIEYRFDPPKPPQK